MRIGLISLAAGAVVLLGACGSDAAAPFASEQEGDPVADTGEIPVEPFPETLSEPFIIREAEAAGTEVQDETSEVQYTIQPGDTLANIAEQFGTTAEAVQRLNGLADPSILRVGDVLRIPVVDRIAATTDAEGLPIEEEVGPPPGEPYAIQPGDTLTAIGLAFGVDHLEIAAHNNLSDFEIANLQVGQVIIIPPQPEEAEGDPENSAEEDEGPTEPPG